jgi:hypothetical protein
VAPPGGSFNMTEAALQQAQREYDEAAQAVLRQFRELERAVVENPSKGLAFNAAHNVAGRLSFRADEFQRVTRDLAEKIGLSRTTYVANSDAGAEAMNSVAGMVDGGGGESFNRLVRG